MRRSRVILLACCFALPILGIWGWLFYQTQSADRADAILDRAIRAHGGEDNIRKTKVGRLKAKGKIAILGHSAEVSWDEVFQLPGQYKRSLRGKIDGNDWSLAYVVGKDGTGWIRQLDSPSQRFEGKPLPVTSSWNAFLVTLVLLKQGQAKRAVLGQESVNGRLATGVRITLDTESSDFYFDNETGLLVKSRHKVGMPSVLGGDTTADTVYSDFQTVDRVVFPFKISSRPANGGLFDITITRVEFVPLIPEGEFGPP